MYAALWRVLPGNRWVKGVESLVLFLAVVALLFLVVFPKVTPLLPYENVTVETPSSTATTSTATTSPASTSPASTSPSTPTGRTPGATP